MNPRMPWSRPGRLALTGGSPSAILPLIQSRDAFNLQKSAVTYPSRVQRAAPQGRIRGAAPQGRICCAAPQARILSEE